MLRELSWALPAILIASSGCGDDGGGGEGGAGATGGQGSSSSSGASSTDGGSGSGGSTASGTGGTGAAPDECPSGTRCIPDPPADWSGPGGLILSNTGTPTACEAPWSGEPVRANLGELINAAECTSCTCGAPGAASCTAPTMTVYGDGQCTSGGESKVVPASGGCVSFGGGYGAKSTAVTVSGGSCAPSGGQHNPEIVWELEAMFCGGAQDGGRCSAGLCAVEPSEPFGAAVCIHKNGDVPCPGGYPARTVAYGNVTDNQTCSACSCTPNISGCDVLSYGNTACTGMIYPVTDDSVCNLGGYYQSAKLKAASAGACVPSGGVLSGDVQPIDPVTFCCIP